MSKNTLTIYVKRAAETLPKNNTNPPPLLIICKLELPTVQANRNY